MEAGTLKQVYAVILRDKTVSMKQFEQFIEVTKNFNGNTLKTDNKPSKRGRPKGAKNRPKDDLESRFSQPNKKHDD